MSWLTYSMWKGGLKMTPIFATLAVTLSAWAQGIPNPIAAQSFLDLINAIAKAVMQIGGIFAVVAIVIVGFKFLTASVSGDTKSLGEAKKMLWWVLIGTAIVVGASVLAQVVVNTIKTLGSP